jgi:sugar phosphate isomerase/epimerase
MNRDDIVRMAQESGCDWLAIVYNARDEDGWQELERFVALVAAHEREECAKVANAWQTDVLNPQYHCDCATAIRRRGEQ